MVNTYLPLLVLFSLAGAFVTFMLVLSSVTGPRRHTELKDQPFECGTVGSGSPNDRLSVKYYLVAMIFILFDVEIVFMYPWAVQAVKLGWYGYFVMVSFLAVVAIGLLYVWKRGVLEWNS
jgi:NADH-quinone oxidoreductase subunit A